MKTYLYRASNLKSTITFLHSGSHFLAPTKNRRFLRFIQASSTQISWFVVFGEEFLPKIFKKQKNQYGEYDMAI